MPSGATIIVGGQYGSEGKGVVAAALADRFRAAVRVGGPNAGHSFRYHGRTYKMRGIPCAWINPDCELVIGAGAVIDPHLLSQELSELPGYVRLTIDAQATVVTEHHAESERRRGLDGLIGSTTEGVGQARVDKLARMGQAVLARDCVWPDQVRIRDDTAGLLHDIIGYGRPIMLEGTQGSMLSLHHGHYPYVTSADTNASGIAADVGIAPVDVEHVLMVIRTLPIRVAGNSGPMGKELDWADLSAEIPGLVPERTTVTDKIRRIAMFDPAQVQRAIGLNRPCGVFLMFTDYLAPQIAGTTDWTDVYDAPGNRFGSARGITDWLQEEWGVPTLAYGTGGPEWELAWTPQTCGHGRTFAPFAAAWA